MSHQLVSTSHVFETMETVGQFRKNLFLETLFPKLQDQTKTKLSRLCVGSDCRGPSVGSLERSGRNMFQHEADSCQMVSWQSSCARMFSLLHKEFNLGIFEEHVLSAPSEQATSQERLSMLIEVISPSNHP